MKIPKNKQKHSYYWLDDGGLFNFIHVEDIGMYWGTVRQEDRSTLTVLRREARRNNREHTVQDRFHVVADVRKNSYLLSLILQFKVRGVKGYIS